MRARALALITLFILLGIPSFLYWYFFSQQTSSVYISLDSIESSHVELHGTLSSHWLPLADTLLVYKKNCVQSCQFDAIPPVNYHVLITGSGKIDIEDDIKLSPGEHKMISYKMHDGVSFSSREDMETDSELLRSLVLNANTTLSGTFSEVGIMAPSKIYALRKLGLQTQLGLIFPDKFIPIRDLPENILSVTLDITKKYFLVRFSQEETLAISTDMSHEVNLSVFPESIVFMEDGNWKIKTASGAFTYDGMHLSLNPRFTDFLDISPMLRIGYIDTQDANKLQLSNFSLGQSVLIMLNRETGENYVLKKGIAMKTLFMNENKPMFIDLNGKTQSIIIPENSK